MSICPYSPQLPAQNSDKEDSKHHTRAPNSLCRQQKKLFISNKITLA